MSNYKFFLQYKNELKTLSQVVNKFDFKNFVNRLIENDCKGNFTIFEPNNVLGEKTRFAFLSFAIQHIYVTGGKVNKDKTSDLQLVNFLKVLFELSQVEKTIKVRGQYDNIAKVQTWEGVTQISLPSLLKLWEKATKAKKPENVTNVANKPKRGKKETV